MWRVSGRFSDASSGSRKIANEPSIGPSWAGESRIGICSSPSSSSPSGSAKMLSLSTASYSSPSASVIFNSEGRVSVCSLSFWTSKKTPK
jgi:Tfp pilus assembly protein FimT